VTNCVIYDNIFNGGYRQIYLGVDAINCNITNNEFNDWDNFYISTGCPDYTFANNTLSSQKIILLNDTMVLEGQTRDLIFPTDEILGDSIDHLWEVMNISHLFEYSELFQPNFTFLYDGDYDINLTVLDNYTNEYYFSNIVEVINNVPTVNFTFSETTVYVNNSITCAAQIVAGNSPFTYLWDLGDDTTYNTSSITHVYGTTGTFTASLAVTDFDGDVALYSIEVLVEEAPPDTDTNTGSDDDDNDPFSIPGYHLGLMGIAFGTTLLVLKQKSKERTL
jgi:hypothetical protein